MDVIPTLEGLLAERILVVDGAMGTMLQQRHLSAADFGGAAFEGCHEHLVRTRPDVVLDIHRAYLAAGADIIETNSFGGTRLVLAEYGLADAARALNFEAARLARQAANEFATLTRPRFVAGAMGPTTKAISVTGGVTFPDLVDNFYEQARALVEGGVDVLLLETCQDTRTVKAALVAIDKLRRERGTRIPVMVSGTIESAGTMLAGQAADAFCASLAHADLLSIGLNCATGPEAMTDHLRMIAEMLPVAVSCYPNAGLPDEDGLYRMTPEELARQLERFVDRGWLNLMGGCCGTTDAHIRAIAQMADGKRPRQKPAPSHRACFSGIDLVEADENNRPLIVGERTNVIGSRAFKNLISQENWEEATEVARRQVKNGAHVIDVCLQSTERDEIRDVPPFYDRLIRKVHAPIMIDSTDPEAIELALTYCQGKSIINSVNLEDGEEKFARVCPLAKLYGAALVVGCIDEDKVQAQAFTRERKLEVAERSYRLLTEKYDIPPEDILIDPLVFPCASGDAHYAGGAAETIEAIRLVKQLLPHARTILGISNVSFGLPPAAREVVNSVFLHYCTKAGLDLAIVNTEKLERYASIPEAERQMAHDLLFSNQPADLAAIAARFRAPMQRSASPPDSLTPDQKLARYIIEGTKDGLIADLDRKLAEGAAPLAIINGALMDGMREVGRLFNNDELIVAEVLQSAEAMKAAVSYLERFFDQGESAARGKILLATVQGDVHDIGKDLVEIILANNGYTVINLGIRVSPEALIAACREHRPDAIGLSGLLVKSAQQMATTAREFRVAGIRVPLLVGGAALSEKFTRAKIAPAYGDATFYAKDAMTALRIMNQLMDPKQRDQALAAHRPDQCIVEAEPASAVHASLSSHRRSSKVRTNVPVPVLPYPDREVCTAPDLAEVWSYISPFMLYGRHLGYKGIFEKSLADGDPKALALHRQIEELKREATQILHVRAVWQFFEAQRDGNAAHLFVPGEPLPVHTFRFPRQTREDGLCLSDYILDPQDGHRDYLCVFATTAGAGVREQAERWKHSGEFFKAHAIQALALETAEAAAAWLHARIRRDWGLDAERGKRYSFGYPACPDLDNQRGIWKLLQPEEIGIALTESMMMDPEASVSALVFHHPDCAYFAAGDSR
ncbi:MAG TPA: methionine synthase [Bryobacteraceae bacterium]|nr:methionine synthase [Bryobacteraceae bacterium]